MGVADYNLSATAGPLTVYHQRVTRIGGGADLALIAGEYDDMATGADLVHVGDRFAGGLHAEQRRFSSFLTDFDSWDVRGNVAATLTPAWRANLTAGVNRSTAGAYRARSASLTGGVAWAPSPLLRLDAELRGWRWRQGGAPDANIFGGGVGVQYRLGGTDFGARWDRTIRLDREIPFRDARLTSHVARSF